jgi:hypothetical protein
MPGLTTYKWGRKYTMTDPISTPRSRSNSEIPLLGSNPSTSILPLQAADAAEKKGHPYQGCPDVKKLLYVVLSDHEQGLILN